MNNHKLIAPIAGSLAALALVACTGGPVDSNATPASGYPNRGLPQGSEPVTLDPADFTTKIDNPYWPMSPGSKWVYSETDTEGTEQKVVVTVTNKTKTIANGVNARVVRDVVAEQGIPVEITRDWYAQDKDGNIWYLGEAVRTTRTESSSTGRDHSRPVWTAPRPGWQCPPTRYPVSPTVRSTTRARPRTRPRSSPSHRSRWRCPSATSTRTC